MISRYRVLLADFPGPFLETVGVIGMTTLGATLLLQGRPGSAVFPVLALFAVAAVRLTPSLKRLLSASTALRYHAATVASVRNELENTPRSAAPGRAAAPVPMKFERSIDLVNVRFRYAATAVPAVDDVSQSLPRGSVEAQ